MSNANFSENLSIKTAPLNKDALANTGVLLLDCKNGARKGALVASLLGLLDEGLANDFISEFNRIGLEGIQVDFSKEKVGKAICTKFEILDDGNVETFASSHESESPNHSRSLSDVSYIIDTLEIDGKVAADAIGIYEVLAEAEATAHETFPGSVHFHEVGNNFAIASIVAFCDLMNRIHPRRIVATQITTGFGFVNCAHGRIAIPAPATANVLNGLPTNVGEIEGELTTPTGAAMVSYFANEFVEKENIANLFNKGSECTIGNGIDNKKFGPISAIVQIDV